jgi:predicted small lipoprotein YifL
MRTALRVCIVVAALAALGACGERPPRADPEAVRAYDNETPQNPLYERTREQGRQ